MQSELHLLSFDVPYPPDYGGVIDVFYKLKALHAAGIKVHLHCFEYHKPPSAELNKYAASVSYYPRKSGRMLLFNTLPYIVLSRNSAELKKRLLEDKHPILMEGLHTTALLSDPDFRGRQMFVRTHNVEHDYYDGLAVREKNIFKRYYFYNEAGKLRKYEPALQHASGIAAISRADADHFTRRFKNVRCITAFHPFDDVRLSSHSEDYAFYHGNLAIGENNEAALFLVNEVFNDLPVRFVIAGHKPGDDLRKAVEGRRNIELHSNLSPDEIHRHIHVAACNVLPTFQSTGIKLKLLAALFSGRTCIVNKPMVDGTGLESICTIAGNAAEFKAAVLKAMTSEIDIPAEESRRKQILEKDFSNSVNARRLVEMIFGYTSTG